MNTKPLTARIPAPLDKDLETLAIATQRSKTYHVTRAVTEYLEREQWQSEAIASAVAEDDRGAESIAHERVAKWLHSWDTASETSAP